MHSQELNREVVGMFFKEEDGSVHLNSLVVLQEEWSSYHNAVCVSKQYYDVDYSKGYGYIFHMSGCGGDSPIEVSGLYFVKGSPAIEEKPPAWVDPQDCPPWQGHGTKAIVARNPTQRLGELPLTFAGAEDGDLLSWLQNSGIESDSVWCSTCRDCFPGNNEYDLCEHCWWCDATGEYSTPSERCTCTSQDKCRGE